jgi:hypothetical protein
VQNTTQDDSKRPEVSALCVPDSAPPGDAVELALAKALVDASTSGRFDVVAQVARELEARLARAGNVVRLDALQLKERGT